MARRPYHNLLVGKRAEGLSWHIRETRDDGKQILPLDQLRACSTDGVESLGPGILLEKIADRSYRSIKIVDVK